MSSSCACVAAVDHNDLLPAERETLQVAPELSCTMYILLGSAQIRVNQEDRQLTISGERRRKAAANGNAERDEDAEPASRQRTWERRFGKFKRAFKLPETADLDAVSARCVMRLG